jgi:hypothetical protein
MVRAWQHHADEPQPQAKTSNTQYTAALISALPVLDLATAVLVGSYRTNVGLPVLDLAS